MAYTQDKIEECMKEAWSYESRDAWGRENLETEFIGTVQRGKYLHDLYVDTSGHYWFKVRVMTDMGIVSEYEALFGRPEKKRYGKRTGSMTNSRYYRKR